MSKADALTLLTHELKTSCEYIEIDGQTYTCNVLTPREVYQVVFTAAPPPTLRSLVYTFSSTHDLRTVIADVSHRFGSPLVQSASVDWATWSLGATARLHLRSGSDRYTLILDDDEIARRDYEEVQRTRNAAAPPRF